MIHDHQDAFGHAMYDYSLGKDGYEIVERDDGYCDISGGPRVYFSQYRDWPVHYKKAVRLAGGRVLDIGCGAGRIGLYLQANGLDVVGIDTSPKALQTCRKRGLKNVREMSITQVSSKLGQFDTLIMLGNNFGLMGDFSRARWLLRRFRAITKPGAIIIAESNEYTDTAEPSHLQYHRRNKRRGRMPGQCRIRIRYKTYMTPWFDYLLVTRAEMKHIVESTGWLIEEFIDSAGPAYIAVIKRV